MVTLKLISKLYGEGKMTFQEYSTYKGQIKAGNEEACIKGLKGKGIIE